MKVVILHAYSRTNAGDGLLVDEAVGLVQEAVPGAELSLVAMAPESFGEFRHALNPVSGENSRMGVGSLLRVALTGRPHPSVTQMIEESDLAVAVGGGYLRASNFVGLAKTLLSQITQMPRARSTTPYVYLPQSIGPFPLPPQAVGIRRLRRAQAVFVRDDRSLGELTRIGVPATRMPDLAALALARQWEEVSSTRADADGGVALVARSLGRKATTYNANVWELAARTQARIMTQSHGRGNDDPSFYRSMGFTEESIPLRDALHSDAGDRPGVVVSVRLHGALQSILAGVPSIHLSYERKGWGAYDDLGIPQYVHKAKTFELDRVLEQIESIQMNPAPFWTAIERQLPHLQQARQQLINTLSSAAAGITGRVESAS